MTEQLVATTAKNSDIAIEQYALEISASWHRAAQSVIETALALKKAREELGKREFSQVTARLKTEGVMHPSTVTKLLKIADNPVLTAPANIPKLPASYATLYDLSRRDTHVVEQALSTGALKASTIQKDLRAIFESVVPAITRAGKTQEKVVAIRLKGDLADVPDDLLNQLNELLTQIEEYVVVSVKGMND